jgi:hypothetical protein
MMQRQESNYYSWRFFSFFDRRRSAGESRQGLSARRDSMPGNRTPSTRWLRLPLFLSLVLGCVFSLSTVSGRSQDRPQDKPVKQKVDQREKAAKKQSEAQAASQLPEAMWRDPGDIDSLDLLNGAGGAAHAPRPDAKYVFVKEDMNGTSPKFYIKDEAGVEWLVKMGVEAKPETAAARFVWAMGYFTDEDYLVPRIQVSKVPKLRRGSKFIEADGTLENVRLKRQGPGLKKIENWDWFKNPFLGTKEFNGLRIMMALLNNWDLTTINNKVYATQTERHFVVADLGASFGKTGAVGTRSKGVLKDYEDSKFIRERKGELISFEMRTRPLPIVAVFDPKNYEMRSRMVQIEADIPIADAAWIGSQLAKLTPQQISDAFRAAGYSADEVDRYTRAIQKRIAELNAL